MRNNFNKLTNELNILKKTIDSVSSLSQISSKNFSSYRSFIIRKEFLESKISKLLQKRKIALQKYNNKNTAWMNDGFMNCRRYYKLEQKAAYHRDKTLYKLGFLLNKPCPPSIQFFKNFYSDCILFPISDKLLNNKNRIISYFNSISEKSPIYKYFKKMHNFIQKDLPVKLTNAAVSGTKRSILSYRKFTTLLNNNIQAFSRNISCNPAIRYLSYVKHQAEREAILQSNNFSPKQNEFRARLAVPSISYTQPYSSSFQPSYTEKCSVSPRSCISKTTTNNPKNNETDLYL